MTKSSSRRHRYLLERWQSFVLSSYVLKDFWPQRVNPKSSKIVLEPQALFNFGSMFPIFSPRIHSILALLE